MANNERPFFRHTSKDLIEQFEKSKGDVRELKSLVYEIKFRKKATTSLKTISEKAKRQIDLLEGKNNRPFFRHTSKELIEQFNKSKNNISELKSLLDEIYKRKKAATVLKPLLEKVCAKISSIDEKTHSEDVKTDEQDIAPSSENSIYKRYSEHFGRVPSADAMEWMPAEQFDALAKQALRDNIAVVGWDSPVKGWVEGKANKDNLTYIHRKKA